jgi:hypothetical protein
MAYLETLNLVTGDTLPDLRFTLKDQSVGATGITFDANDSTTWAPISITGGTLKLRIRLIGSAALTSTISGVISDGAGGEVVFPFEDNPFTASGLYEGEIEITFSTGGIQTLYDLVKFKVRNDFD